MIFLAVLGNKPIDSCMLSKQAITMLQPQPNIKTLFVNLLKENVSFEERILF